jgi:replicative DNA helicase
MRDLTELVPFDDGDEDPFMDATRAPTPLSHSHTLPAFPVEALPAPVAAMVRATATFTATDPAMGGPVALAAIAALVGGHVEVEIRPGYREPTNVWSLVVANPAERKSSVHAALTAPVLDLERELVEAVMPAISEAQTRRDVAEKAAETARKVAGSASTDEREAYTRDAIDAAANVDGIAVPAVPRLVMDDTTPEALVSALAEQDGRLAIISSEAGVFAAFAGRYNPDQPLDPWLKSWSGDPIRVDRRGRKTEYVARPTLTLAVMVQPDVLRTAARHADFRGSGLLARFCYSMPASTLGTRDVDPAPIPEVVRNGYSRALLDMGRSVRDTEGVRVLHLAADADAVRLDFARAIEPRLGRDGDLHHVADWAGKLAGTTARIAGLLHMAASPDGPTISRSTMAAAVTIGRYYIDHALAAFDAMGGVGDEIALARHLLALIRRRQMDTFTARQVFNLAARSWLPDMDAATGALDTLQDYGWIERLEDSPRSGPGRRPSPMYQTHPDVFGSDS